MADVILLNVWAADVGRVDGATMKLLEAVFAEVAKTAAEVSGDENRPIRTGLLFVVRDAATDVDVSALGHSLVSDAADVWGGWRSGMLVPLSWKTILILRWSRFPITSTRGRSGMRRSPP